MTTFTASNGRPRHVGVSAAEPSGASGRASGGAVSGWLLRAGLVVVVAGIWLMVFRRQFPGAGIDRGFLTESVGQVVQGRWWMLYATNSLPTTPLYPLFAGAVVAVLGPLIGTEAAFGVASAVAVGASVGAGLMLLRAVAPAHLRRRRLGMVPAALALLAIPQFLLATTAFWHPGDVAGVAVLMCAVACAVRRQATATMLTFALAVLTRQWCLLAAGPVLLAVAPEQRRRVGLGAAGLVAAGLLPFVLATPVATSEALRVEFVAFGGLSGLTDFLNDALRGVVADRDLFVGGIVRYGPLVVAAAFAWLLWRRHTERVLGGAALLGAITVTVSLRLPFEPTMYAYYPLGAAAFAVVLAGSGTWRRPDGSAVSPTAVDAATCAAVAWAWAMLAVPYAPPGLRPVIAAGIVAALAAGAVVAVVAAAVEGADGVVGATPRVAVGGQLAAGCVAVVGIATLILLVGAGPATAAGLLWTPLTYLALEVLLIALAWRVTTLAG